MEPLSPEGQPCGSCYGQGELGTERGPAACPDCDGTGRLPARDVLVERRMRAIEAAHAKDELTSRDVRWLAFELRRARRALVQVMTLTQDANDDESLLQRIRFLANDALGIYEPTELD